MQILVELLKLKHIKGIEMSLYTDIAAFEDYADEIYLDNGVPAIGVGCRLNDTSFTRGDYIQRYWRHPTRTNAA